MAEMVGEVQRSNMERLHPSFLNVIRQRQLVKQKFENVKHRIGIYSAKGGVGKTTVAVNIAYTLKDMGYKVALLDADVDTPNVSMFLGINESISMQYPLKPVERHGVKVLSTAMFINEETKPIIWRGPLVAKMIGEFFMNTEWGELDYLIIDLPPGTSDSPLSIMQLLELDGFILVTTPQHIAAVNAIRSGRMAKRLGVSILGVVENMHNGEERGGKHVASTLNCEFLGRIKTNPKFDKFSDSGKVPVSEDNDIKEEFISIVEKLTK